MYKPKVPHAIKTVYDEDHYENFLKEKGYDRTTSAQLEYLDMVNSNDELREKYMPLEKERADKDLSNNLGSNWRDFYEYDYETGRGHYKDGYSQDDIGGLLGYLRDNDNISSIGIDRDIFSSYRKGDKGGDYSGNKNDYYGNLYDEYERLKKELIKKRELEFNANKELLIKQAQEAARKAYIDKLKNEKSFNQINALLGKGGKNQQSIDNSNLNYQNQLDFINNSMDKSLESLEKSKNSSLTSDLSKIQKDYESQLKNQQSSRKSFFNDYSKIVNEINKQGNGSLNKAKIISALKNKGYTQEEIEKYLYDK